ncbi:hypothetical protein ElyMa_004863500 [Elysia marginata]|uniref:Uncharacterized protein n=1 Tax=Elysia marginata TaxID=1093978 RepID=A0AAV4IU98_9GAST|nr:hypothetical protein ElyMa_004863500 [Elysia marginata]
MHNFFVSCGYPLEVLDDACNRVSKISRTDALIPRPEQSSQCTKLIMTYHPHNLVARKIVLNNLSILQADPDAREVFDEPPLVEERKTFATCWYAVGSLRLMTQEPDLAGDLGVKLVLMCHSLVKSTHLLVFSRLLTHSPALVAT